MPWPRLSPPYIPRRRRFPSEDATAVIGIRAFELARNQVLNGGTGSMLLQPACLVVQSPERVEFLFTSEFGALDGGFQHANRFVVDLERHWKWMAILAAMRKRKPSGI